MIFDNLFVICGKNKFTMPYIIRNTHPDDLTVVVQLYATARQFMKQTNNPNQWKDDYPPLDLIKEDISKNCSYICENREGEILAVFFYSFGQKDPTYLYITDGEWLNHNTYGVVHRIASTGRVRGIAQFCINWCFEQSKNLRIDTHKDNKIMQHILKKLKFERCGVIYLENGDERVAYQKTESQ